MDLSQTAPVETRGFAEYKSPWRALAWSFRKSRDGWKQKYAKVKREIKRFQNQARDVTKSRDQWKNTANALDAENKSLQAQLVGMQAQLAEQEAAKKKSLMSLNRPSAKLSGPIITQLG